MLILGLKIYKFFDMSLEQYFSDNIKKQVHYNIVMQYNDKFLEK